jgi:PAS domain S-box-containing protein
MKARLLIVGNKGGLSKHQLEVLKRAEYEVFVLQETDMLTATVLAKEPDVVLIDQPQDQDRQRALFQEIIAHFYDESPAVGITYLAGELDDQGEEDYLKWQQKGAQAVIVLPATDAELLSHVGAISRIACLQKNVDVHEKRLCTVLDHLHDGVWERGYGGEEDFFSEQVFVLLGYSANEAREGWDFIESCVYSEDRTRFQSAFDAVIAGESDEVDVTVRMRNAQGNWRVIAIKGQVVFRQKSGNRLRITGTFHDVSAVHQHQELVRGLQPYDVAQLEEQARFVYNNPSPVLRADAEGHVDACNPAANLIFGQKLHGAVVFDVFPDLNRELFNSLSSDDSLFFVCRYGGRVYQFSVVFVQESSAYYFFSSDITAQVRAQEALDQEKALLRSLVDAMPDLIAYKDIHGEYVFCNYGFAEFVGLPEGEVIGKSDAALFDQEQAELLRTRELEVFVRNRAQQVEEWRTYPDGKQVLLDTLRTPHRNSDGKVLGVMSISRDITDIRQMEALNARLGRVLDASWNEIYIFDQHNLRFYHVNAGAQRNTGYSAEELEKMTPVDLMPEMGYEEFEQYLKPVSSDLREVQVFQSVFRRKDETTYPVEISVQSFHAENPPVFVAVVQDISKRKLAEDQLRARAEELEQFNRLMVGREERIIQLKEEVNRLSKENGGDEIYPAVWDEERDESEAMVRLLEQAAENATGEG